MYRLAHSHKCCWRAQYVCFGISATLITLVIKIIITNADDGPMAFHGWPISRFVVGSLGSWSVIINSIVASSLAINSGQTMAKQVNLASWLTTHANFTCSPVRPLRLTCRVMGCCSLRRQASEVAHSQSDWRLTRFYLYTRMRGSLFV